jgi:hypothetical protein
MLIHCDGCQHNIKHINTIEQHHHNSEKHNHNSEKISLTTSSKDSWRQVTKIKIKDEDKDKDEDEEIKERDTEQRYGLSEIFC